MEERHPKEDMRTILNKIKFNSNSLHISRVPKNTREKFVQIANDEYCGDYGLFLKALIDGLVNPDFQEVYAIINELNSRIEVLERQIETQQDKVEDDRTIKTLNGKMIKR